MGERDGSEGGRRKTGKSQDSDSEGFAFRWFPLGHIFVYKDGAEVGGDGGSCDVVIEPVTETSGGCVITRCSQWDRPAFEGGDELLKLVGGDLHGVAIPVQDFQNSLRILVSKWHLLASGN